VPDADNKTPPQPAAAPAPPPSAFGITERLRLLIESVRDYAIFMLDPEGNVLTWNKGAESIKGYRADEIIGQHISKFYTGEDLAQERPRKLLQEAATRGRVEDEGWRVRKDGTHFWADVILTALRDHDGDLVGFAKVTRDLTDRRRAENERVQLAQAQEALRLRDEFLAVAAHELKTPMTVLQLQLHGLIKRAAEIDSNLSHRAGLALRAGKSIAGLIDSLLDASRIAGGTLELNPERLDLSETAGEVVERFRELADQAGCELVLRAPAPVFGQWDRLRIEQALTNVLSNALKYAPGSPVTVSITASGDGSADMEIRDRGPGVPESAMQRIFGRYERAVSARHYGGMGLGLYVTRQIVEHHGGTVTARNAPDGGASFLIRLPVTNG
jgi:PAS domain S-box-containing protein